MWYKKIQIYFNTDIFSEGIASKILNYAVIESHMIEKEALDLFDMAVKHGIHRTVHAGIYSVIEPVIVLIDFKK